MNEPPLYWTRGFCRVGGRRVKLVRDVRYRPAVFMRVSVADSRAECLRCGTVIEYDGYYDDLRGAIDYHWKHRCRVPPR